MKDEIDLGKGAVKNKKKNIKNNKFRIIRRDSEENEVREKY